jgi:ribosomal protein S18 acetylase RimI-like enzyme
VTEANAVTIRPYEPDDEQAVVAVWEQCGLLRPWNDPHRDIARKVADSAWGFLVAENGGRLVGAMMVGYDGHRGSVNYLGVVPSARGTGLGRRMMERAEALLRARGCPKVNLSVRADNVGAVAFYEHLGYVVEGGDHALALGHRLIDDTSR